jgi:hypothetical protein
MKAARSAGEELSLDECLVIAKRKLGIAEPAPKPAKQGDAPATDEAKEDEEIVGQLTVADIETRIKELKDERIAAFEDLNGKKVGAIEKEIQDLEELAKLAHKAEQDKSQAAARNWESSFDQSVAKAGDLFPDFMDGSTDFHARCKEVDSLFKETNDPRFNDSDKPLMIAQLVAKELGVLPRKPGQPAKPQAAPAQSQPAARQSVAITPKPARIERTALPTASGASRTQTPAPASLGDRLGKIKTTDDWERLERELASSAQ